MSKTGLKFNPARTDGENQLHQNEDLPKIQRHAASENGKPMTGTPLLLRAETSGLHPESDSREFDGSACGRTGIGDQIQSRAI